MSKPEGGGPAPGMSSAMLNASGAMDSNPGSGNALVSATNGGKMLPFERKEIAGLGGDATDALALSNGDTMFAPLIAGGGPFGSSITDALGGAAGYLGTQEAKGDNIALEQVGSAERQAPPNIQGDLQMNKGLSFKGGASAGG